jgi:hypothetical protein
MIHEASKTIANTGIQQSTTCFVAKYSIQMSYGHLFFLATSFFESMLTLRQYPTRNLLGQIICRSLNI